MRWSFFEVGQRIDIEMFTYALVDLRGYGRSMDSDRGAQ